MKEAVKQAGLAVERLDAAGVPKVKTTEKTQFPRSMDAPHIDAAGQKALGRALAGAPGASHTPPVDGTFAFDVPSPAGTKRVTGTYQNAPGGGAPPPGPGLLLARHRRDSAHRGRLPDQRPVPRAPPLLRRPARVRDPAGPRA